MKAVRFTKYGGPEVLRIEEVEKPGPEGHQVLIKVHAASINALDYRTMRANPFFIRLMGNGVLRPKDQRLGQDVAGRVEAVGEEVTQFRPGDEVFGCADGAFAEYTLARETFVALKPANKSFEEVAAVPVGALTALQGLRFAGEIHPGQKILIQGASGSVGVFALQLAKLSGAEVTAVCSSRNVEMAHSLGADQIIDYKKKDFTRSGQQYDLIFAVNGYHSIYDYRRALNPQGKYVCAGGTMAQLFEVMLLGPRLSKEGGQTFGMMGVAKVVQDDLVTLGKLLEDGQIVPIIDHCYPLENIADAMRYVEDTHPQGKVVIQVR